jgi:hypothetical protein
MFESEVKSIMIKYKNTLDLIEKLQTIYKPYEDEKKEDILSIDFYKLKRPYALELEVKEKLENILRFKELPIKADTQHICIEELAKIVTDTTIDDFYNATVRYFPHNSYVHYELKNMEYSENRIYPRNLERILNCIWLLDHKEPINEEKSSKIYKLAENGETFVFQGCKVTRYKNGNLKIKFSDDTLFKKFEDNFNKALQKVKEGIKE